MKKIELSINQSLDEIIDILTDYNKKGEYVTCTFNGIALDSENVNPDHIYKKCTGMTKNDYKSILALSFNGNSSNVISPSKKSKLKKKFIEEGKQYIYPQKMTEWEAHVLANIQTVAGINVLEQELELIKEGSKYDNLGDTANSFKEIMKYDKESLDIRRNALKFAKYGDKLIRYKLGGIDGEEDLYDKIVRDIINIREDIIINDTNRYFDLDKKRIAIINTFIDEVVGSQDVKGLFINSSQLEEPKNNIKNSIFLYAYYPYENSDINRNKREVIGKYIEKFNKKYGEKYSIKTVLVSNGDLAIVYPNRSTLKSLKSGIILYDPNEYLKERKEAFIRDNVEDMWIDVSFIKNLNVFEEIIKAAVDKVSNPTVQGESTDSAETLKVVSHKKGVYKKSENTQKNNIK